MPREPAIKLPAPVTIQGVTLTFVARPHHSFNLRFQNWCPGDGTGGWRFLEYYNWPPSLQVAVCETHGMAPSIGDWLEMDLPQANIAGTLKWRAEKAEHIRVGRIKAAAEDLLEACEMAVVCLDPLTTSNSFAEAYGTGSRPGKAIDPQERYAMTFRRLSGAKAKAKEGRRMTP